MNAREVAFATLTRIEDDKAYSHLAVGNALDRSDLSPVDKRLTTQLVYGVLGWRRSLDILITKASKRPIEEIDAKVLRALRLGAYQIAFLRVPDHAAVGETVELVKAHAAHASGFVNGVLRKISSWKETQWWRDSDLEKKPVRYLGERFSLPGWIANRLVQMLGLEEALKAAESFNALPVVWARKRNGDAIQIDNFEEARESIAKREILIQDLGAQYAVLACGDVNERRVLDACAGLGGKSLYLADRGAKVVAVEPNVARLAIVDDERIEAIPSEISKFTTEELFDVVLVDAPCTGLGVIRRHPETRWRKNEADIVALSKIQTTILDDASRWVKPGGKLVYCVCTFTREETGKQREKFLERHPEFTASPLIIPDVLQSDDGFVQLWPHVHGSDAFYICSFTRKADA